MLSSAPTRGTRRGTEVLSSAPTRATFRPVTWLSVCRWGGVGAEATLQ